MIYTDTVNVGEFKTTRAIDGVNVDLCSYEPIRVECEVEIFGSYVPACIDRVPEDCYPAEYPDVEVISAKTIEDVQMYDRRGEEVLIIAAGTEIGPLLTDAQARDICAEVEASVTA